MIYPSLNCLITSYNIRDIIVCSSVKKTLINMVDLKKQNKKYTFVV